VEWFLEFLARQGFRLSYRGKPGKDLNDLITTTPMGTMLVSRITILISAHKPFIAGRDAIILNI